MVDTTQLVAIFFKGVNFAVLVGLAVYFYRKNIKEQITKGIVRQRMQTQSRTDRAQELFEQTARMQNTILADRQTCDRLQQEVGAWAQEIARCDVQARQEREAIEEVMCERQEVRQKNLDMVAARRAVLPGAVESTVVQLLKRFDSDEARNAYLASIMSSMRENKGEAR